MIYVNKENGKRYTEAELKVVYNKIKATIDSVGPLGYGLPKYPWYANFNQFKNCPKQFIKIVK